MGESASPELVLSSRAKLTSKKVGIAPEGALSLTTERLTFKVGSRVDLDVPITSITNLRSPWFMLGEGMLFEVGPVRYSCTFNKLSGAGLGRVGGPALQALGIGIGAMDIARARKLGRAWFKVLTAVVATADEG